MLRRTGQESQAPPPPTQVLVATGLLPHEAGERVPGFAAERGPGVHEPPEGAPKVAERLEGGDGRALGGIWPHHLHDHLIDEPWEDLHDGPVLVLGSKDAASNKVHLLAELAFPLRVGRGMCLAMVPRNPCSVGCFKVCSVVTTNKGSRLTDLFIMDEACEEAAFQWRLLHDERDKHMFSVLCFTGKDARIPHSLCMLRG